MKLVAFVDCETSGLRKHGLPEDDQPHLLQLACRVVDERNETVGGFSRIIRPEGWSIEPEAEAVHGISATYASRVGVDLWVPLLELRASIAPVDEIVGFGIQYFDRAVISEAIRRVRDAAGTPSNGDWWFKAGRKITDLMELATPILKLVGNYGTFKFPTLKEAVDHFTEFDADEWPQTHRADDDIEMIRFLYWKLKVGVPA